jgi:hypothetical protein
MPVGRGASFCGVAPGPLPVQTDVFPMLSVAVKASTALSASLIGFPLTEELSRSD